MDRTDDRTDDRSIHFRATRCGRAAHQLGEVSPLSALFGDDDETETETAEWIGRPLPPLGRPYPCLRCGRPGLMVDAATGDVRCTHCRHGYSRDHLKGLVAALTHLLRVQDAAIQGSR